MTQYHRDYVEDYHVICFGDKHDSIGPIPILSKTRIINETNPLVIIRLECYRHWILIQITKSTCVPRS